MRNDNTMFDTPWPWTVQAMGNPDHSVSWYAKNLLTGETGDSFDSYSKAEEQMHSMRGTK